MLLFSSVYLAGHYLTVSDSYKHLLWQSSEATKTVKTDAEILKRRKKEEKRQEV